MPNWVSPFRLEGGVTMLMSSTPPRTSCRNSRLLRKQFKLPCFSLVTQDKTFEEGVCCTWDKIFWLKTPHKLGNSRFTWGRVLLSFFRSQLDKQALEYSWNRHWVVACLNLRPLQPLLFSVRVGPWNVRFYPRPFCSESYLSSFTNMYCQKPRNDWEISLRKAAMNHKLTSN